MTAVMCVTIGCKRKKPLYETTRDFYRFRHRSDYYSDALGTIFLSLMIHSFFEKIDPFVIICFRLHDFASELIAKHLFFVKRLLLIAAAVSLLWILFPGLRRNFGSLAEYMLLFILFLSPVSKIFRMRLLLQLMGLRREFGILMGCFALVHGVAYFVDPISFSFDIVPYLNTRFFSMRPLFYFGILSLMFTLPLLLTSNNFSVRTLGAKRWKMLHRTVYVLLLAVLLHVLFLRSMRRGYTMVELIQPASIIFGYVLLKALAWKNFIAPLQGAIAYVSERYKNYVIQKGLDPASVISS